MDKVTGIISGIIKNTIIPPIDSLISGLSPTLSESIKNLGRDYHEKKGRPMIYPYTFTAKLVQFPYKYYFNKGWIIKHYVIAVLVTVPMFHKLSKGANSPANKREWARIREEWYGDHGHH